MVQDTKRYFLKNANLLEEIHNSKITYCCYENAEYTDYDIICSSYSLITPDTINTFFKKNEDKDYIIIRVDTDEHILPYVKIKNGKVNLQDIKMAPFKHFILSREDFYKVFEDCNCTPELIEEKRERIKLLKEQIKDNKKNIRFNKLNKELQEPYKEFNKQCEEEIAQIVSEIKNISNPFSTHIKDKLKEVVRSHWKGKTIKDGEFCCTHGHLTDALVHMIIMLVDQFARSGNWAGYTYIEDMKSAALVQLCDVALKFNEKKSKNAFAYLTQVASMKFTATLNSEKVQRKLKSKMLQDIGYDPTFGEQIEEEFKNNLDEWLKQENGEEGTQDNIQEKEEDEEY